MKRIATTLKDMGLLKMHEFEVKYINDSSSSDESGDSELEYVEDSEGSEYKLKKRDKKEIKKNKEITETIYSKAILSTLDVQYDDPRIKNDPSITNPSLRMDKDLPKSTLSKVMEFRRNNEQMVNSRDQKIKKDEKVKDSKSLIDDLIIKKETPTEIQEIISRSVANSKIDAKTYKLLKISVKLEKLQKQKDYFAEFFKRLKEFTTISIPSLQVELCKSLSISLKSSSDVPLYSSNTIIARSDPHTELKSYFEAILNCEDLSKLETMD